MLWYDMPRFSRFRIWIGPILAVLRKSGHKFGPKTIPGTPLGLWDNIDLKCTYKYLYLQINFIKDENRMVMVVADKSPEDLLEKKAEIVRWVNDKGCSLSDVILWWDVSQNIEVPGYSESQRKPS